MAWSQVGTIGAGVTTFSDTNIRSAKTYSNRAPDEPIFNRHNLLL